MTWIWILFIALIGALLALDLGVFNRKEHVIGAREAAKWTMLWVSLALAFGGFVYLAYQHHWFDLGRDPGNELSGTQAALQYFTGYLIEESLSLDNIFVIALIISYFSVPPRVQHRVLFWGIFGAMVMRGIMIVAGIALIRRFEWVIYVFGVLLVLTALKLLVSREQQVHPEKNILVRLARKLYPVTRDYDGSRFFSRVDGKRAITPLFLVLLVIESSDVMFALDSIPAIFAVTRDPFIVFTSNVFAILGLRSLYFAVVAVLGKFRFIRFSLVCILAYVGIKMLLSHTVRIPTGISLGIIAGILGVGVAVSLIAGPSAEAAADSAAAANPSADSKLTPPTINR